MILYACSDLLWATRVKAAAEALGIPARPVRSVEMLRARLADSAPGALVVDLETGSLGIDLIRWAVSAGGLRVVAFGPHVEVDALSAAREAGAHRVLSRGAFADRLPDLLRELGGAGGAGQGSP
jgi:hypothetical protein